MTDEWKKRFSDNELLCMYHSSKMDFREESEHWQMHNEILSRMSHKTCVWEKQMCADGAVEVWVSECGGATHVGTGTRPDIDNGYIYCHYCGGEIIVKEAAKETDHNPT